MNLRDIFLNDKFIFGLIVLNSIGIFIEGFRNLDPGFMRVLHIVDAILTLLFILEAVVKIHHFSWKKYIKDGWNKMDFFIVIASLPSFLIFFDASFAAIHVLLVLRVARAFKFFRFLKFIPDIENLILGINRAMRASVLVVLGFAVYSFTISILSCYVFRHIAPEHFGDPLISFYSSFKIFTVEGWYEIPDSIAAKTSNVTAFFTRAYFMFTLLTGGILGFSIINSIFVDAMVMDNNDNLEEKVDRLTQKVEHLLHELDRRGGIQKVQAERLGETQLEEWEKDDED